MRLPLLGTVVLALGLRQTLHGVAASASERSAALPGDDLVPDATVSMDRAATLPASPDVVWPWLVQLGKGRGGWYFPRWLEAITPASRRASRRLDDRYTTLRVGDDYDDWGPGRPVLRLVTLDAPHSLVYHSLRDPHDDHRWPRDPDRAGVFAMSWTLSLRPVDGGSRLHLRVRARTRSRVFATLGDLFDGLTVALLVAGLRERITA